MTAFHEGRHPGEFLLSEANFHRSRDAVNVAASQTIEPGQVLAARVVPNAVQATATAAPGNAGNATIALATPAVSAAVKPGVYRGVATAATKVSWEDPAGVGIGQSTHGAAFDGPIRFTIAAGGTATAAGDVFEVEVTAGAGSVQHAAYDPATDAVSAVDAVALHGARTGAGETVRITAITRDAEVSGAALEYIDGVTSDQRAGAVEALKAAGIIAR